MTVGALLDLGGDIENLKKALGSLNVSGYEIKIYPTEKCGIGATKFDVILESDHHHSHDHHHEHHHHHDHDHNHSHDHEHHHHSHDHPHEHRGLNEILEIINRSDLTDRAKSLAIKMFDIVAQAEAKCHRIPVNEVHFHEVGAVDSIVDIVAVAVLIDQLDIGHVITGRVNEGTGSVKCQHGIIPVPSPATAQIASTHGIPLNITDAKGEMVTPTGAAILACLTDEFGAPDDMIIEKMGIGAGTKDFDRANILRAFLLKSQDVDKFTDTVVKLETNIDDTTGEQLGFVMDMLFEKGVKDVFFTPIIMKKNRPSTMITVLTDEDKINTVVEILFKHTSTIGVRYENLKRKKMFREFDKVNTKYGEIEIKKLSYGDINKISVEYDSAKDAANRNDVSIKEIENEILKNK